MVATALIPWCASAITIVSTFLAAKGKTKLYCIVSLVSLVPWIITILRAHTYGLLPTEVVLFAIWSHTLWRSNEPS